MIIRNIAHRLTISFYFTLAEVEANHNLVSSITWRLGLLIWGTSLIYGDHRELLTANRPIRSRYLTNNITWCNAATAHRVRKMSTVQTTAAAFLFTVLPASWGHSLLCVGHCSFWQRWLQYFTYTHKCTRVQYFTYTHTCTRLQYFTYTHTRTRVQRLWCPLNK